jgi:hypothetical protein
MRTRRRLVVLVGSFSLLTGGVVAGASTPASAQVCVLAGTYTPTLSTGTCQPLFEEWISPCAGLSNSTAGVGGYVRVCVPTPV